MEIISARDSGRDSFVSVMTRLRWKDDAQENLYENKHEFL